MSAQASIGIPVEFHSIDSAQSSDRILIHKSGDPEQLWIRIMGSGTPLSADNLQMLPSEFALHQNFPNPFNPITNLSFDLPRSAAVALTLFDITGRQTIQLLNQYMTAGSHQIVFDGSKLSSGIYFYSLKAGFFYQCRKMVLQK